MKVTASKNLKIAIGIIISIVVITLTVLAIRIFNTGLYKYTSFSPIVYRQLSSIPNCKLIGKNVKNISISCNGFLRKVENSEGGKICYNFSIIRYDNLTDINTCEERSRIKWDGEYQKFKYMIPANAVYNFTLKTPLRYVFNSVDFSTLDDREVALMERTEDFVFAREDKYFTKTELDIEQKNFYYIYTLKDLVGDIVSITDIEVENVGIFDEDNIFVDIKAVIYGYPVKFRAVGASFLDSRDVNDIRVGTRIDTNNYKGFMEHPKIPSQALFLSNGNEEEIEKILSNIVETYKRDSIRLLLNDLRLYSIYAY